MNIFIFISFILVALLPFNKLTVSGCRLDWLSSIAFIFSLFLITGFLIIILSINLNDYFIWVIDNLYLVYLDWFNNDLCLFKTSLTSLDTDWSTYLIFLKKVLVLTITKIIIFLTLIICALFFLLRIIIFTIFNSWPAFFDIFSIPNFLINSVGCAVIISFNFVVLAIMDFIWNYIVPIPDFFIAYYVQVLTFQMFSVPVSNNLNLDSSTEKPEGVSFLNPWYVTGFADGEGNFSFRITESANNIGWSVGLNFKLVAAINPANLAMFEEIKNFFGVGRIRIEDNLINYWVTSLKDCLVIRDHFLNYPLLTYKAVHFQLWSTLIDLMLKKEHLTSLGLLKVIALKAHLPYGLSEKLQTAFPNYTAIPCPVYSPNFTTIKINVHWMAGFINADGSFGLRIFNSVRSSLGAECQMRIQITQHNLSLVVLEEISKFLGVGKVYPRANGTASDFKIQNLAQINNFIEQFKEAQLLGAKALDYADFCKGITLINKKAHLTTEGLTSLKLLADGMNSRRKFND